MMPKYKVQVKLETELDAETLHHAEETAVRIFEDADPKVFVKLVRAKEMKDENILS